MVFDMNSWREKLEGNKNLQAFRDHLSGKSERTQHTYLYNFSKICEFFSWDCSEFDPHHFTQEHYDELFRQKSKVMKCASVNLYTNIVKVLSNIYGLEIKTRTLKEIDRFSDYITFEELQEIINKADKEAAAVTTFIFCTGLRPVSVLSLKKNQLMLNTKHPYLKNVLLKGGRHQDIIIMYPDLVKPLLTWYLQYKSQAVEGYDKNEFIFVSQKGMTTDSYIYSLVRTCSRILGRSVSPRMLRKGLGIHTKELGLQDEVRRMIMGHSNVKTTIDAYSDYSVKDVAREISMKASPQGGLSPISRSALPSGPQDMSHEQCPFCGGVVEPDMLFCPHCWQEIQSVCENCKRFINVKWKKCVYCGADVRKKAKYEKGLTLERE
jgi:integrase/RNA polymerase subunit RPABC4/transcription elongation factor Spt4